MKTLENLIDANPFHSLGTAYFSEVQPSGIANPKLVSSSKRVAQLIGIDSKVLQSQELVQAFSGNKVLPKSKPLAMVYSGHQFGGYSPRLGDGRSLLLGNSMTEAGSYEISLKGAGETPFSRFADGRAVLRSSIREYLCSEAMAGLGIPTTRALCVIRGEDKIMREEVEPSATVVRVARSHIRFGSFEYFYHTDQQDLVKKLADFVIENNFPHIMDDANKYFEFVREIVSRTATMIALWQSVGFSHGVMNTDNMSIIGDTLDYGPFGFMEEYNPGYICNHSDHEGRYAFNQQPQIGLWNLNAFAQTLTGLLETDALKDLLGAYESDFVHEYGRLLRGKLGLVSEDNSDFDLINEMFSLLEVNRVDFTIFFRKLSSFLIGAVNENVRDLFIDREAFDVWGKKYSARLQKEGSQDEKRKTSMNKVNAKYILRNYMVHTAIEKAQHEEDFSEVNALLQLLNNPFDEQLENERYAGFSPDWGKELEISCSS